jgi:hypothetical protein
MEAPTLTRVAARAKGGVEPIPDHCCDMSAGVGECVPRVAGASCATNRVRINFYNHGAVEVFGLELFGACLNALHTSNGRSRRWNSCEHGRQYEEGRLFRAVWAGRAGVCEGRAKSAVAAALAVGRDGHEAWQRGASANARGL